MSNIPESMLPKESTCSSPSRKQLPMVSHAGLWPQDPPWPHTLKFWLIWTCPGYVQTITVAVSWCVHHLCHVQKTVLLSWLSSLISGSYGLSTHSSSMFPEPWLGRLIQMIHPQLGTHSHLFLALWPALSLCIYYYQLQKQLLWPRLRVHVYGQKINIMKVIWRMERWLSSWEHLFFFPRTWGPPPEHTW